MTPEKKPETPEQEVRLGKKTKRLKVRLGNNTKLLMLRRRMWRQKAVAAMVRLMTWQTGAPGKDEIEKEVIKSLQKVRQWFRDPQKTRVVMAIERRAVAAFRQQNTGN